MATLKPITVAVETQEVEKVVAAVRLCVSQVGFSLDSLLVNLKAIRDERERVEEHE